MWSNGRTQPWGGCSSGSTPDTPKANLLLKMNDLKEKVLKEIEKNQEEEIRFLQKLVQTPSSNPFVKNPLNSDPSKPIEKKVAFLIYKKLKQIGLSPKFLGVSKNRPNVIASLGKGKKTLIFNGHMDTIIPPSQYSFDPYSGMIKDNKVWGVGVLDMKASLAAYVFMAKALFKFKEKLRGRILLQFVVDEEPMAASLFGTAFLLKKGFKGKAAIVGEPGSHKITIGNKGGYRFKLEVFGEAIHTGSREWEQKKKGKNAILEMTKAIQAINKIRLKDKPHPAFPKRKSVLTFPTTISGGKAINIVPDVCVAFGDARLLPGITQKTIEKEITKTLKKLKTKHQLTPIVYVPPTVVRKNEPIVKMLRKNIVEILNQEPKVEGSGPWSDIWMFNEKGIPAINFGCKGGGFHSKDEWVEIKSVIETTKIYALTAIDFLS